MQVGKMVLPLSLLILFSLSAQVCRGHNITKILAQHPEFSTFNHYLTITHLATEINRRLTITLLAVDNAGMAALLDKHLPLYTVRNVLELHVLVDYFGAKKLHQLTGGSTTSASMFQATGAAPGTTGYVNISDHRAGKVTFTAADDGSAASSVSFMKSIKEIPYNFSVLQISSILSSPEAEAPAPGPAPVNLSSLMTAKGCAAFASLLNTAGQMKTFNDNIESGLTVFCPIDSAVKSFMPKYKNLTAEQKSALLLYHGYPVYNSIQMLKSNNGVVSTLATDGASKNYNFTVQNDGEIITLKTPIITATIKSTVLDQDPLAVYTIDKVLEPRELFKGQVEPPAPAPAPAADEAKSPKGKKATAPSDEADAPSDDQKAADDNSAAFRVTGELIAVLTAAIATVIVAV